MKQYKLPESIVATEVAQLLKHVKRKISVSEEFIFDLSEIRSIDSAGIALLIHLKTTYPKAQFLYATAQINNLCQLYKIQL